MTVGQLRIILTASTIGLTNSLRAAKTSVASFSASVRVMGTRIGTGLMTTFRGIGTSITGIFHTVHNVVSNLMAKLRMAMLVAAAGFALVTWAGAQLEDALMRTFAVLSRGAEGFEEDLKQLTDMATKLGRETLYTATNAAEGMKILALAGFKTVEILGTIPGVLELAIAAGSGLAEVATIIIAVLKSLKIETEDTMTVTNLMTYAFTSANMTLLDLGESLKYVAAIAGSAFGPGIETLKDLSVAIMMLANAGLQGSMAGTQLRMMITKMLRPTGMAVRILARLGYTFLNAATGAKDYGQILIKSEQQYGALTDGIIETRMEMLKLMNAGRQNSEEFKALSSTLSELQSKESLITANMAAARTEFELTGGSLKPLRQIIPELIDLQLNAAQITQLFGVRAGIAASIFASSGKKAFTGYLKDLEKVQKNQEEFGDLTSTVANLFRETVKGAFADVGASAVGMAKTMFWAYKENFKRMLQSIRDFINDTVMILEKQEIIKIFVKGLMEGLKSGNDLLINWKNMFIEWLEGLKKEDIEGLGKKIGESFSSFVIFMGKFVTDIAPQVIELLKSMWAQITDIDWIGFGESAVKAFEGILEVINKIVTAWEKIPAPVRRVGLKTAAGAAIAGPTGAAAGFGAGVGAEFGRTDIGKALQRWSTRQVIEQQVLSEANQGLIKQSQIRSEVNRRLAIQERLYLKSLEETNEAGKLIPKTPITDRYREISEPAEKVAEEAAAVVESSERLYKAFTDVGITFEGTSEELETFRKSLEGVGGKITELQDLSSIIEPIELTAEVISQLPETGEKLGVGAKNLEAYALKTHEGVSKLIYVIDKVSGNVVATNLRIDALNSKISAIQRSQREKSVTGQGKTK